MNNYGYIFRSIIESGMANVPSPIKRMDSSPESSSSGETGSSESDSDDSSSGSQVGGENGRNSPSESTGVSNTVSSKSLKVTNFLILTKGSVEV